MSFEAYLSCFENGEQSYFTTSIVNDAFAPFITSRDPEFSCWLVTYQDSPSALDQTDLYLNLDPDDASRCSGFTVARPTSNIRLFDSLLRILQATNSTIYCPGECPPMVGRAEAIAHLSPELVEALGTPVVVLNGNEIRDRLERS
ncbi:hypothetical protein [Mesorhizobium delmotii]|uniref:Uncharacterized protein n=1 Tax=Mesorhizobium delmotii TaxID=1631247 RepID=A0A2P9AEQ2_9HYPH|nr:hypothetical protein [Mesorhizobium delmotii]SJM29594.1 conserved hypothetical protein [Mesorhizobium delmotii]